MRPRIGFAFGFAVAAAAFAFAGSASAADVTKAVADGVTMTTRAVATPNVARVLVVDLGAPGVHLGSTKTNERKSTTSSYAKLVGAAGAVNGDFFSYATYSTSGLAAGGGGQWAGTKDNSSNGTLAFDGAKRVELTDASKTVTFDPTWMKGVVSGHPQLVNGGTALASNPTGAACTTRNPRTAVGITADKKKLIVAVVDGRSSISAGMTCTELAALMKSFGADDAFNLDGGGSSTMYLRGTGVVNKPSDGTERVVGNHLAIFAPKLGSVGTVKGIVHVDGDKTKLLTSASVTLQGAGTDVTDAMGRYELDTVPGKLSVTAKKPGYAKKTVPVDVAAGADVSLDIGLVADPNADFDGDKIVDSKDNCPEVANPDQADLDQDGKGDVCDSDDDNDGLADEDDPETKYTPPPSGSTTDTSATEPSSAANESNAGPSGSSGDSDAEAESGCTITRGRAAPPAIPSVMVLASLGFVALRIRKIRASAVTTRSERSAGARPSSR
jgi:hypothetical protein